MGCANCSLVPDDPFSKDYLLGDLLGEGSYAMVRSATSKVGNVEVAVKIFKRRQLITVEEDNIREEFRILKQLDHPNILKAYDFFEGPEYFYFVLEKIHGGELFERIIALERYSEEDARNAALSVLQGIAYMHSKSIVHRDLKPENLLLTSIEDNAAIKIVDFGFAKEVNGNELKQQCGSAAYMAPEVILAEPYGIACDIWSFGVILYMLLSGAQPFFHASPVKLFRLIVKGDFEFPNYRWEDVSTEAKELIKKLLCVDQAKRLTAEQALQHPWLIQSSDTLRNANLQNTKKGLKVFSRGDNKFVAAVNTVIATHRMKKIITNMSRIKKDIEAEQTPKRAYSGRIGLSCEGELFENQRAWSFMDVMDSDCSSGGSINAINELNSPKDSSIDIERTINIDRVLSPDARRQSPSLHPDDEIILVNDPFLDVNQSNNDSTHEGNKNMNDNDDMQTDDKSHATDISEIKLAVSDHSSNDNHQREQISSNKE